MNLSDMLEKRVRAWMINQGQENIVPGMSFEGTLKGIDQGTYIIKVDSDEDDFIVVPIGSCKLLVRA
ncbi:MAG: hypothetical protein M1533_05345 [Candidatus Thermoplasmatota archaeon]|jgi:hypothetical protein|nr:hypothetical protein [Candidatus Thermoplasmatota archaeon]MCL5793491.1 hypothetical protein [Candidatus Thermoplasmatota archaeon]